MILYGTGDERVQVQLKGSWGAGAFRMQLRGRHQLDDAPHARDAVRGHAAVLPEVPLHAPCSACGGPAHPHRGAGREDRRANIAEVTALSVEAAHAFFDELELKGAEAKIAAELLKEIRSRLRFLLDVGLGYLTLDRPAPSLSGGEGQRIRLASQIGSELTGVIYVLDEPSIGLHQRDNRKLLAALKHLRDIGNTVVVVEHDREAMEESDWLIDFGPGAGRHGGEIVAAGTPAAGHAVEADEPHRPLPRGDARDRGARRAAHGRRPQPHGRGREREQPEGRHASSSRSGLFVCVTGVSGAGKSTLVNQILYPAVARALHGSDGAVGAHRRDRRARARSTRSSTSTRARSAARRAATPRPTPSCST